MVGPLDPCAVADDPLSEVGVADPFGEGYAELSEISDLSFDLLISEVSENMFVAIVDGAQVIAIMDFPPHGKATRHY